MPLTTRPAGNTGSGADSPKWRRGARAEVPDLQARTVRVLVGSQVLGGVGVSAGASVGALLAEEVSGSAGLAGLGGTFQVLGAALIAIPMSRVMAARGRRPGLQLGYGLAVVGALAIVTAGVIESFPLLLLGSALFGGSTASNSQARYAAVDLADDTHRGRDLSIVVWATTVGAVLGPNLAGPAEPVAVALGLPVLTGPFAFSLVGFVLAALLLTVRLRPDPLIAARERHLAAGGLAEVAHGSVLRGLRVARRHPETVLGMLVVAVGHTVMVSVMVMTPLHMHHGGAELRVIGLVISLHVLGMFAFSPLVGLAVDRFGGHLTAVAGSGILVAAGLLAALAPEGFSPGLAVGLFLLGLGWSFTLISGSTLLTRSVPLGERPGVQGASDLLMGLAGGGGGALAGLVVGGLGYRDLGAGAAVLATLVSVAALGPLRPRPTA
ncbi:MAG: MFS transporter [Sporichthyaceae bacterium]